MNRYVRPSSRCRSFKRFRIWAWTDTSSALVGSSRTMNFGFRARARAIPIRCRCPPLNSCGNRYRCSGFNPTRSRSVITRERRSRPVNGRAVHTRFPPHSAHGPGGALGSVNRAESWIDFSSIRGLVRSTGQNHRGTMWDLKGSATIALTSIRGFIDENGSWNTICMPARRRRTARGEILAMSIPPSSPGGPGFPAPGFPGPLNPNAGPFRGRAPLMDGVESAPMRARDRMVSTAPSGYPSRFTNANVPSSTRARTCAQRLRRSTPSVTRAVETPPAVPMTAAALGNREKTPSCDRTPVGNVSGARRRTAPATAKTTLRNKRTAESTVKERGRMPSGISR